MVEVKGGGDHERILSYSYIFLFLIVTFIYIL